jgi:hypothetical protein
MSSKYSIGNFLNYFFDTIMFILAVTGFTYLVTVGDLTMVRSITFYVIASFFWIIQTGWRAVWSPRPQDSVEKHGSEKSQ